MKKLLIFIIIFFVSASSQTIKQIFSSNEFCRRNAYPVYPNPDGTLVQVSKMIGVIE